MLKQNFIFKDLIPNQQAAEKEEQEKQKNAQDGFNQIFDPKRMLESVDSFFKELKIDSLNKEEVY